MIQSSLLFLFAVIQILVVISFKQYSIKKYNYIKKPESNYLKFNNNDFYRHLLNRCLVIDSHNIKHESGYQNVTSSYEREQPFQTNIDHNLDLQNNTQMKSNLNYFSTNTEDIFIKTFTTAKYSNGFLINNTEHNDFFDNSEENSLKHNLQKSRNLKKYRQRIKFNALSSSSLAAREKSITKQDKLPLPFMNVNLGLRGNWVCRYESYVLKPYKHQHPIGIIHFLGGAFVGAAPHLTYRYFLEQLCEQGYIIIATPYRLQLDYLSICDHVLHNFGKLTTELNAEYGYYEHNDIIMDKHHQHKRLLKRLPIIGIGHSSGAFLHSLISSLFPDIPRAANILISYNNRPASDSVPVFNDLLVPVSTQIARFTSSFENEKVTNTSSTTTSRSTLGEAIGFLRRYINLATNIYTESTISPSFVSNEVVPLVRQGLELVDQIPPLLGKLSHGQRQFTPSPSDALECVRRNYRTPYTLLLRFADDLELDQSEELLLALKEANTIMKMRRNRTYEELNFEMHVINNGKSTNSISQNVLSGLSPLKFIPKTKINSDKKRLKLGKMFYGRIKIIHDEIYNFLNISIPAFIEHEHEKSIFGKAKNTVVELKKKYGNHYTNITTTSTSSTSSTTKNNNNIQKASVLNLEKSKSAFDFTPNKNFLINSETNKQSSKLLTTVKAPSLIHTKQQQHAVINKVLTISPADRISPSTTAATEEELEDSFFTQKSPPKQSRILKTSYSKTQSSASTSTILPSREIISDGNRGKKSTIIPPSSILKSNTINNKRSKENQSHNINSVTTTSYSTTTTPPPKHSSTSSVIKLVNALSPRFDSYASSLFMTKDDLTNRINLKWKLFLEWIKLHFVKIRSYVKKIHSLYLKHIFQSSKQYAIDFDWDMSSRGYSINTKKIQKRIISGNINIQTQWENIYNYFTKISKIDIETRFFRLKSQINIFNLNSLSHNNSITKEAILFYTTYHSKVLLQHALIVIFLFFF